jgi:hypothetical protein
LRIAREVSLLAFERCNKISVEVSEHGATVRSSPPSQLLEFIAHYRKLVVRGAGGLIKQGLRDRQMQFELSLPSFKHCWEKIVLGLINDECSAAREVI